LSRRTAIIVFILIVLSGQGLFYLPAIAADGDDSVDAWRSLKSIDAAIALDPLDGPEDIREKEEIIADRIDKLKHYRQKLQAQASQSEQIIQSLRNQKEILRNLAEIKQGQASRDPQQMHELTDRILRQEQVLKQRKASLDDLQKELNRLQKILDEYNLKANTLQRKESGAP